MKTFFEHLLPATAVLLVTVHLTHQTVFEATGMLTCSDYRNWCFYIEFIEVDHMFKDDRLDRLGILCIRPNPFHYHLKGEEDGDGLWNNYYEIKLMIRHNCTDDGTIREAVKLFDLRNVTLPKIDVHWDVNAFVFGNVVDRYIP